MAGDRIVGQNARPLYRGVRQSTGTCHAHVLAATRSTPLQEDRFAQHAFARGNCGQGSGGGPPSAAMASLTMYSAQHGSSAALPSPPRENGVRPTLELNVVAHAVAATTSPAGGAAVPELWHEMAKLMACIGLCKRLGPFGDAASSQYFNAVLARKCLRVEPRLRARSRFTLRGAEPYGRRAHSRIEASGNRA